MEISLLDTLLDTSWLRFTEDWDQQGCEQSEMVRILSLADRSGMKKTALVTTTYEVGLLPGLQ